MLNMVFHFILLMFFIVISCWTSKCGRNYLIKGLNAWIYLNLFDFQIIVTILHPYFANFSFFLVAITFFLLTPLFVIILQSIYTNLPRIRCLPTVIFFFCYQHDQRVLNCPNLHSSLGDLEIPDVADCKRLFPSTFGSS